MLQEINTDTWHRKEIFDYFCGFDEPYFGITADVHVSKAYQCAKEKDISFFVYYLHCTLIAINQIDALKLRILETKPVIFDTIHASATINRPDGSFGFSFINFEEDLQAFNANFQQEADRIRTSTASARSPNRCQRRAPWGGACPEPQSAARARWSAAALRLEVLGGVLAAAWALIAGANGAAAASLIASLVAAGGLAAADRRARELERDQRANADRLVELLLGVRPARTIQPAKSRARGASG